MKPFIGGVVFENQKEIKKRGEEMLELISSRHCKECKIMATFSAIRDQV